MYRVAAKREPAYEDAQSQAAFPRVPSYISIGEDASVLFRRCSLSRNMSRFARFPTQHSQLSSARSEDVW